MNNKKVYNIVIGRSNDICAFLKREKTFLKTVIVYCTDNGKTFRSNVNEIYDYFHNIMQKNKNIKTFDSEKYSYDDYKNTHIKHEKFYDDDNCNFINYIVLYVPESIYAGLLLQHTLNKEESGQWWF